MKKETVQKLKDLGLDELQFLSKRGVETLFSAIEIIIKDSDNKIDDMVLPTLPIIKTKLLEFLPNK